MPDGNRASRSTTGLPQGSCLQGSSSCTAPTIIHPRTHGIRDQPVLTGNVRKASEVQKVAKLVPARLLTSVAAGLKADRVAGGNSKIKRLPQLDLSATRSHPVVLDKSDRPVPRPRHQRRPPALEPAIREPGKPGKPKDPPFTNLLNRKLSRKTRTLHIKPAEPVAQNRRARLLKGTPERNVQSFADAAQFGAKGPTSPNDLTKAAGELKHSFVDRRPIDQPRLYLGPVIAPRHQVRFGDRGGRQGSHRLGVIHRESGCLLQRAGSQSGVRAKCHAVETQVPVMVCEPKNLPVPSCHRPCTAHGCCCGRQMGKKLFCTGRQSRTSTTGTLGASPA